MDILLSKPILGDTVSFSSALTHACFAALALVIAGSAAAANPVVLVEKPELDENQVYDVLDGEVEVVPGDPSRALEFTFDGRALDASTALHIRATGPDVGALSVVLVEPDGRIEALSPEDLATHVVGQELDLWLGLPELVEPEAGWEPDGPFLTLQLFHVREVASSDLVILESVVGEESGVGQANGSPEPGDDDSVPPAFTVDAEMLSVCDDDDDTSDDPGCEGCNDRDECDDEEDNDGDGYVDCDDQDCLVYVICDPDPDPDPLQDCSCSLPKAERDWLARAGSLSLVLGAGLFMIARRKRSKDAASSHEEGRG